MKNLVNLLGTLLISLTCCQTTAPEESLPVSAGSEHALRLACRINSYGPFQDAAWSHLPEIGIKYIFLNIPAADEVSGVKQRLSESGLTVVVLRGDADLSQESSVQELEAQLAICQEMDVKYMFLSPKRHGAPKEQIYSRLRAVGDIADTYDVTIVLETHPDLGTNGEVHLETMRQINHPRIRVNFDTGNIHYYNRGTDAPTELEKVLDYVATVEIKDHNGVYEDWNFPTLGQGVVDIPGVLEILWKSGYDGPITIEIEGIKGIEWDEETTKQAIKDSVMYLRSLGRFI
ncbi:MAG: sugar phosphate isomerase/epimerase family protein [bacterium]